jgi:hypothetical protein
MQVSNAESRITPPTRARKPFKHERLSPIALLLAAREGNLPKESGRSKKRRNGAGKHLRDTGI